MQANDAEALRQYASTGHQDAFAQLVRRHVDWVYSTALRMTHDQTLAEDVTQGVFLMLSQKADRLSRHPVIAGWLFRATQFGARAILKAEQVRKKHEERVMRQAPTMTPGNPHWTEIHDLLDEAVGHLKGEDRTAIVLRFYQQLSLSEVGDVLGIGQDAARKRVARAVGRLRERLGKGDESMLSAALLAGAVGKAPEHLTGAILGGSHGVGAAVAAKGIKIMTMLTKLKVAAAVAAMVCVPVALGAVIAIVDSHGALGPAPAKAIVPVMASAAPASTKAPFTVSNRTTSITEPLHDDGSVDYVAALNERYGQNVTPENNGFVVWLSVVGPNAIAADSQAQILAMCGVDGLPNSGQVWQSYSGNTPVAQGPPRMWRDQDNPALAAFLKDHEKLLDLAVQAAAKPKWWMPAYSPTDSMNNVALSAERPLRDVCWALCQRSLLRAQQGDFDGFMSDVMAVKRLSNFACGWTAVRRMLSLLTDEMADQAIGSVAGSGAFSAEQWQKLGKALDASDAAPPLWEVMDITQRWSELDAVQRVAMGKINRFDTSDTRAFGTLDQNLVDWDAVMRHINEPVDEAVNAMKLPLVKDQQAAIAIFDAKIRKIAADQSAHPNLTPESGETKEAYSQRVADNLTAIMMPTISAFSRRFWAPAISDEMTRAIVALAQYRAENGNWPAKLDELVPRYLPQLPKDAYSTGGQDPVRYSKTDAGVLLYSVGPNQVDNGGRNQGDIAVGAAGK